jgi:hypothetical protein
VLPAACLTLRHLTIIHKNYLLIQAVQAHRYATSRVRVPNRWKKKNSHLIGNIRHRQTKWHSSLILIHHWMRLCLENSRGRTSLLPNNFGLKYIEFGVRVRWQCLRSRYVLWALAFFAVIVDCCSFRRCLWYIFFLARMASSAAFLSDSTSGPSSAIVVVFDSEFWCLWIQEYLRISGPPSRRAWRV